MDPITHFLYGATLARTGLNRKAAYTTLAMTLAAETPDLDVVWGFGGPVTGFEHHRGITHTFLGLPFEGLVVLGVVYLVHRIRLRRKQNQSLRPQTLNPVSLAPRADEPIPIPLTYAPVRWALLYCFILLALLSHLFLDWTNNYGIRPFFPFSPRWYELSTVFIIEPLILLCLLSALLAPPLFGLIAGEIGARRSRFRGRGWAIFALLAIAGLWGLRQVEHDAAIDLASQAPFGPAGAPIPSDQVLRIHASPSPINPFVWHIAADTPDFYQLATVDTLRHVVDTDPAHELLYKPPSTGATLLAKGSPLGRVYLDWSSWPLVSDQGPSPLPGSDLVPGRDQRAPGAAAGTSVASIQLPTEVLFRDLRFLYNAPTVDWHSNPPLAGQVYVDLTQPESNGILGMYMNGHRQP